MARAKQHGWVLPGIGLGVLLFVVATNRVADADLDRAGMGRNTVPRTAVFEEKQVSAVGNPSHIFPAWRAFRDEGHQIGLWLGASQVYCINNIQPEDRLAVEYMDAWAKAQNMPLRMLQLTAPNGNLYELLAFYLVGRQQGYVPDWLIIGLVYDDLREEQIRDLFLEELAPISQATQTLGGPGAAQLEVVRKGLGEEDENKDPVARNPTTGTPQEHLETALVAALDKYVPGYAQRDKLTGQFKITVRAALARMLGQVSQRRVPPVPEARKTWNHAALRALVNIARADGCKVLIYQPPHRETEGPFYHDREKYDAYFAEVVAWVAGMDEVHFLDLEPLVPPEYWGVTNWGRPDVFHFSVEGHRRLAAALQDFFASMDLGSGHAVQ